MAGVSSRKSTAVQERKPRATFPSPLPLVNPETLFSIGVWGETFDFIADYLPAGLGIKKIEPRVTLTFRDLYFSKFYNKGFSLNQGRKSLSEIGEVNSWLVEPNDRNNELHLDITYDGLKAYLYEYKESICFKVGDAVATDALVAGHIDRQWYQSRPPVVWKTDVERFGKFVDALEKSLIGQGSPDICRASFTLEMPHVLVDIQCFYHPIMHESRVQIFAAPGRLRSYSRSVLRKVLPPRFVITFF